MHLWMNPLLMTLSVLKEASLNEASESTGPSSGSAIKVAISESSLSNYLGFLIYRKRCRGRWNTSHLIVLIPPTPLKLQ